MLTRNTSILMGACIILLQIRRSYMSSMEKAFASKVY